MIISLFLALQGAPLASAAELAKINGTTISLEDFEKKYQENKRYYQLKVPTRKLVLDDIMKRELGVQEAKRLKLDKDPDVLERFNTILYQALLEKKLSKTFENIKITDETAKNYYSRNPEIRTSHLFVGVPSSASAAEVEAARKRLISIRDTYLVNQKMGFAEVAQKFSEGMAAPTGGDLDFQTKDRLDPVFYQTALKLKVGQMSEPVRSQFGWHIIKLTAVKDWDDVDKAKIKRLAFEEQREKVFDEYMEQLKKSARITVNTALLKD